MLWLQSSSIFLDLVQLDKQTCTYTILNKNNISRKIPKVLDGTYSFLGKFFIALYVDNRNLYICINSDRYMITDTINVSVSGMPKNRIFILRNSETILAKIQYSINEDYIENDSFTSFIDDEDFDFGLLVKNIVEDKKRQKIFISLRQN